MVSIIIPTYNRAHLIGETLDSVLAQTYTNWECIIVDDGSSDNTNKVVGKYVNKDKRFKYYHRPDEHLPGGNGARNYGFKMSQGEYINWFDSDDLMMPEKLSLKVNALIKADIDFVVSHGLILNKNNNKEEFWNKITSSERLKDHIYGNISFQTNGPMFKRSVLEKTNGFHEKLKRKQDWEYFSRILTITENYYPITKNLFIYRKTSDSINGKSEKNSIFSKTLANILVYKNVLKKNSSLIDISFRKHFIKKFSSNFKTARNEKQYKALFYSVFGVLMTLNVKLIYVFLRKKFSHA